MSFFSSGLDKGAQFCKFVELYIGHSQGTLTSLYAVPRAGKWLGDESRWSVDDMPKDMKA